MKYNKIINNLINLCLIFSTLIYFERFSLLFLGEYPFPENPCK